MKNTNTSINSLLTLAGDVGQALTANGLLLVTAESCTGGGIAHAVTEVAGSSQWFDCGYVTYSNRAKMALLGVTEETLDQYGAVSQPVVEQMVRGAIQSSGASAAIAVSGVAGPGGGSAEKPVGTVCLAWFVRDKIDSTQLWFAGDRTAVRHETVVVALQGLLERIQNKTV